MKRRQIYTWATVLLFMLAGVQRATATYYIPSDTTIGTWDPATRTYTLTTDVSDSILFDEGKLTLDGAGHTVTGTGSVHGVYLYEYGGVNIKNLNVEGFYFGIHVNSNGNTLRGNIISNNNYGIYIGYKIEGCDNNIIRGNTISSNNNDGIYIANSNNIQIYNNNFIGNGRQAGVGPGRRNIFNLDKPIGGNYWNDWTTPDADGDGFVDNPYVLNRGQDNLPWAVQDGWLTTPAGALQKLIDQFEGMDLQKGIEKSLLARLEAGLQILKNLPESNDVAAIKYLQEFIKGVEVQRGKKIPEADADALIAAAQQIIAMLNGT